MRRILPVFALLFLFTIIFPHPAWAMQKFGPHIVDKRDAAFLKTLRDKYDNAGNRDWVPVTVLIPVDLSVTQLSTFINNALDNKFWPILRLFNSGQKISDYSNILSGLNTLNNDAFKSKLPAERPFLIVVFGNEVNYGSIEWGGAADPAGYTSIFSQFIADVGNLGFIKVANAPMNASLVPSPPADLGAKEFWIDPSGPAAILDKIDVLAFNPYELGGTENASIDSWKWELSILGNPNKPIIFSEFGLNPDEQKSTPLQRKDYINKNFSKYNSLSDVVAITPLLHYSNGSFEIPVFGSSGVVEWIASGDLPIDKTPKSPPTAEKDNCGADKSNFDIVKFFDSLNSQKVDRLEVILQGQLPLSVGNDLQSHTSDGCLKVQGKDAGEDKRGAVIKTVGDYTVADSLNKPYLEGVTSTANSGDFLSGIFDIFKNLLGVVDFGNKRAGDFANSSFPLGTGEKLLSQGAVFDNIYLTQTNDINVLGDEKVNDNMSKALPVKECANLPLSVCRSGSIHASPIPTPGSEDERGEGPAPDDGPTLDYYIPYHRLTTEKVTDGEKIDEANKNIQDYMAQIAVSVKNRWPDAQIDHWSEVCGSELAKDWNCAFALSIWIEETGASAVCTLAARVYGDDGPLYKIKGYGIWDFGYTLSEKTFCGDTEEVRYTKFQAQKDNFLGLYTMFGNYFRRKYPESPERSKVSFADFMCRYSEGKDAPCVFGNSGFLKRLPTVYKCLTEFNGSNGKDVCPAGYFKFL